MIWRIPSVPAAKRVAGCVFTRVACLWIGDAAATDPTASSDTTPTSSYTLPADFGNALAHAVNACDRDLVAKFFDVHTFALRVARAASDDVQAQQSIAKHLERSGVLLSRPLDLLQYSRRESIHLVADFKRVRQHGADLQIILRDEIDGIGINYLAFELERDGAGKLRAVDWYDFSAMGWVSSSIGIMLHFSGDVSDDPVPRETVARFQTASQKGYIRAVIAALSELPPPLRESLTILNLRTQAALVGKEPEEARHAMALIAARYSQEPAAARLLENYYRDTEQYDKALKSFDVVEHSLGADGTTNLWRATIYHYGGDERHAARALEKATQLEPDFAFAYRGLAAEYVALKDYRRANATLATLRSRFNVNMTVQQLEDELRKEEPARAMLRNRWSATN